MAGQRAGSPDESASALAEPERLVDAVLRRLARAVRFRDEETAEHVERMSRSCALIAGQLGWAQSECVALRAASALHDIGKVGVPDAVLRKPGPLEPHERSLVERHPEIGHEILAGETDPTLELAASVALTHHERIDGSGYPRHLSGSEIPIEGRIAAVADVFDALTHDRVYRPAFRVNEALDVMRRVHGGGFDPAVFEAFEQALARIIDVSSRYPDSWGPRLAEGVRPSRPAPVLTPREREIVSLLTGGMTGEEIARRLFLSPETVRTHVRNAMTRLGAKSRPHLVGLAIERNEIAPEAASGERR